MRPYTCFVTALLTAISLTASISGYAAPAVEASPKKKVAAPWEKPAENLRTPVPGDPKYKAPIPPAQLDPPANGEVAPPDPVAVEMPETVAPVRGRESWECPANYHCQCHGSGFRVECHLGTNDSRICKDLNTGAREGQCPGAVWGF